MERVFTIGRRKIGEYYPVYFIADIAANHNGSLERAKRLIRLAKEAGADAAKFQHFRAEHIVSEKGFETMCGSLSHQSKWKKSVYQVYEDASVPWEWTPELKSYCDELEIDFFTAPYDLEAIDMVDPYVCAYKVGSGDITWIEAIEKMASKGKPVLLATGAAEMGEVQRAVAVIEARNRNLAILQCNTNYTGSVENFSFASLNVLKTYRTMWPDAVLGLSDHTPGHVTVLGAISLGAKIIEKHFTDDRHQEGPDHAFSMDPDNWEEMVARARELEVSLGSSVKEIEENEQETVLIQRRCLRARKDLLPGTVLRREDIDVLRPATSDSISPAEIDRIVGSPLLKTIKRGEHFTWHHV